MAAAKRTAGQREIDLLFIQERYARGDSQRSIAAELSATRPYRLTHQTIGNDIEELLSRWRQTMVEKIDELQAAELLRINTIEREAWDAWERSKHKKEKTLSEQKTGDKAGQRAQITREDQIGDPRFLEHVRWCITKRCEILGLNAPCRVEHTGKGGGPIETAGRHSLDLSKATDEELVALQSLVSKHEATA